MINGNRLTNQCLRYIVIENQEHVILCIANEDRNDKFLCQLKEKVLKIEGTEEIIHKVLQFIEDIKIYLQRGIYFITIQYKIRYKYLFRGFIIKDWYGEDKQCNQYVLQNEMIVKECVQYYYEYQITRNEIYYNPRKQNEILKKWC